MAFQQPPDSVIDNEQLDRDWYFQLDAGSTAPSAGLDDFSGDGPGEVGDVDLLEHFMGHAVAPGPSLPSALVPQQNGLTLSTEPDVSLSLNGAENSQVLLQTTNSRIVDSGSNVGSAPERRSLPFTLTETASSPPSGSPDPGVQQEVPSHASVKCRCLRCLQEGVSGMDYLDRLSAQKRLWARDASGVKKYHCKVERCNFSTKRWADLSRHCTTKHCTNPGIQKFPCPELGCNYGGANGFTRKDKLKSHYDNVHKGNVMLGKAPRTLKPKPAAGA